MNKIVDYEGPETVEELISCGPSYDFEIKTMDDPCGGTKIWWFVSMRHADELKYGASPTLKEALKICWSAALLKDNNFSREQSLIMDEQENQKERLTDLENKLAVVMQYRVEKDLLSHIVSLRERVEALKQSHV